MTKEEKIIKKAKKTPYKHRNWYLEGEKTVYEAVKFFAESNDFFIGLKRTIKHINQIEGYEGKPDRKKIIAYCIENLDKHWDKLRIKFRGSEGGTDRGKLKLQTYFAIEENPKFKTLKGE
jgi:hypothetical protein